jgi:hypothetical protein
MNQGYFYTIEKTEGEARDRHGAPGPGRQRLPGRAPAYIMEFLGIISAIKPSAPISAFCRKDMAMQKRLNPD